METFQVSVLLECAYVETVTYKYLAIEMCT